MFPELEFCRRPHWQAGTWLVKLEEGCGPCTETRPHIWASDTQTSPEILAPPTTGTHPDFTWETRLENDTWHKYVKKQKIYIKFYIYTIWYMTCSCTCSPPHTPPTHRGLRPLWNSALKDWWMWTPLQSCSFILRHIEYNLMSWNKVPGLGSNLKKCTSGTF